MDDVLGLLIGFCVDDVMGTQAFCQPLPLIETVFEVSPSCGAKLNNVNKLS